MTQYDVVRGERRVVVEERLRRDGVGDDGIRLRVSSPRLLRRRLLPREARRLRQHRLREQHILLLGQQGGLRGDQGLGLGNVVENVVDAGRGRVRRERVVRRPRETLAPPRASGGASTDSGDSGSAADVPSGGPPAGLCFLPPIASSGFITFSLKRPRDRGDVRRLQTRKQTAHLGRALLRRRRRRLRREHRRNLRAVLAPEVLGGRGRRGRRRGGRERRRGGRRRRRSFLGGRRRGHDVQRGGGHRGAAAAAATDAGGSTAGGGGGAGCPMDASIAWSSLMLVSRSAAAASSAAASEVHSPYEVADSLETLASRPPETTFGVTWSPTAPCPPPEWGAWRRARRPRGARLRVPQRTGAHGPRGGSQRRARPASEEARGEGMRGTISACSQTGKKKNDGWKFGKNLFRACHL